MKVFVSYVREDEAFALRLAKKLKTAGMLLWIDQLDIPLGELWDREVEKALKDCPGLLVILSPSSVRSENVMDEVNYALKTRKRIIPVLYKDCEIPFRLERFQYADFRQSEEDGIANLLSVFHSANTESPSDLGQEFNRSIPANAAESGSESRRAASRRTKLGFALGRNRLLLSALGLACVIALGWYFVSRSHDFEPSRARTASNSPILTGPTPQMSSELKLTPTEFTFDYPAEPLPGKRHWVFSAPDTWREEYPDGPVTTYKVIGRSTIEGDSGTLLKRVDNKEGGSFSPDLGEGSFEVFIPDKQSHLMCLRFRMFNQGRWTPWANLNRMYDVK